MNTQVEKWEVMEGGRELLLPIRHIQVEQVVNIQVEKWEVMEGGRELLLPILPITHSWHIFRARLNPDGWQYALMRSLTRCARSRDHPSSDHPSLDGWADDCTQIGAYLRDPLDKLTRLSTGNGISETYDKHGYLNGGD